MADLTIKRESNKILKEFGITKKVDDLLCPILKVLQMRHKGLDKKQATRVIKEVLYLFSKRLNQGEKNEKNG